VVVLNPLLLIVSDGDVPARCHISYTTCVNEGCDWRGPVGRVSQVIENRAALYSFPTALLGCFAFCVGP
jgi:hypothetical protein